MIMSTNLNEALRLSKKIDTREFINSGSDNPDKFLRKAFEKDEDEQNEIEALNICKKEKADQKRIADAIYRYCNRGNVE